MIEAQSLKLNEQRLSARLEQLPGADELEERSRLVIQLQGDQQRLNQRLETVLGASRKDWRLAEAEHLLRLASLRLRRCRTSAAPRPWCRAPMKFSVSRTIRAPSPLASRWRRPWWPCAAPNSRIAPVCSCD